MILRKIIIYLIKVKLSLGPIPEAHILTGKDKLTNNISSGISKKIKEIKRVESTHQGRGGEEF